jgi:hypothetical protein
VADQWYLIDEGHSVAIDLIPIEKTNLTIPLEYEEITYPPTMETPGIDHWYDPMFIELIGVNFNSHKKAHFFVPKGNAAGPLFITIEGMEPLKFIIAPILIEDEQIRDAY